MTFVCVIPVQGGALELRVRAERGVWRWSICIRGGPTLEEGLSQTRTEAHVAAQFAVEQQLRRHGLEGSIPHVFRWENLVG